MTTTSSINSESGSTLRVALVAVETAAAALVPVAGLGIHRRDHPVRGDPAGDAEHPVLAGLDVLAGDQRQQLRRLSRRRLQRLALQRGQRRPGVADQRVDEGVAGGAVVPIAGRLTRRRRSRRRGPTPPAPARPAPRRPAPPAACGSRPQLGDGVLRRHRVVDRRRVQHPRPVPEHARLAGHDPGVLQEPPRTGPTPAAGSAGRPAPSDGTPHSRRRHPPRPASADRTPDRSHAS